MSVTKEYNNNLVAGAAIRDGKGRKIAEKIDTLSSKIGNLSSLETEAKDNLVEAINEVVQGGSDTHVTIDLGDWQVTEQYTQIPDGVFPEGYVPKIGDVLIYNGSSRGQHVNINYVRTYSTNYGTFTTEFGYIGADAQIEDAPVPNLKIINTNYSDGHYSGKCFRPALVSYVDTEVAKKYTKPTTGIPESDLSEEVKTKLNSGGGSSINVVDNLTSDSATDALSAKQGKVLKGLVDGKYSKPSTGIPKGDLESSVQTSLGKADTALQKNQIKYQEVDKAINLGDDSSVYDDDLFDPYLVEQFYVDGKAVSVSDPTKYKKPSGGIPKTDLANAVQTSLGKADTAVQPAAISDMETKTNAAATYQPKGSYATTSQVNAKYTKPNGGIPESDLNQDLQSLIDSIGDKAEYDDIGRFDVGDSYEVSFAAAILTTHSPKTGDTFKGTDTSDNFDHRAIIIRHASNILDFLYSTSEDHSLWYISLNTANNNIIRQERMVTSSEINEWSSKQDAINDLSTIRSNASNGNTAYGYFSNGKLPYASLSGTPSIPAAQVQSDWKATSGMGVILNKPSIPTVTDTYSSTSSNAMSGKAVASAISNVKQLPSYSTANNNMVLSIVNGTPTWVKVVTIYTGTATPASSLGTDGDLYIKM